jgi:hypothetical protein
MNVRRLPQLFQALALLSVLMAIVALHAGHVAQAPTPYQAPRTPWGEPDLQGAYSNAGERLTPMERPHSLSGRRLSDISATELRRLNVERQRTAASQQSRFEDFVDGPAWSSRAWLIVDPEDGRIPPATSDARRRTAARVDARRHRGPADSWTDFDFFSRCISRGLPGSMIPAIYGNTYEIVQAPGSVAIVYEMIHETRVIPLHQGPRVGSSIRSYLGDSRGHFDGDTLVIETSNFKDSMSFLGSSANLELTERFTPISADILEWRVTLYDPATWARPWTFAMNLTRGRSRPIEFACHEGNYSMRHALSAARTAEQANLPR